MIGLRIAAAAFLVLIVTVAQAATPELRGIRIGVHEDYTRVVVEFSQEAATKVDLRDAYNRLWITGEEVTMPDEIIPTPRGLVKATQITSINPLIFVLDLVQESRILKTFTIAPREGYGFRLVVDIAPAVEDQKTSSPAPVSLPAVVPPPPPLLPAKTAPPVVPPLSSAPAASSDAGPTPLRPPRFAPGPSAPQSPAWQEPVWQERVLVVIDAGHGGRDPGAQGFDGSQEKDIVLAATKIISEVMTASGRYEVVLTRESDRYIGLRERVEKARSADADIFISLHADSLHDNSIYGVHVYTLTDEAGDEEAQQLLGQEDTQNVMADEALENNDPMLAWILLDLTQRATMHDSRRLAYHIVRQLQERVPMTRNAHRHAGFMVLRAVDVPSVLIELGFLSNPRDVRALNDPAYISRIAQGLVQALDQYVQETNG
ncbi:MAG: N-acetylmuramoyl-L-alanine amidase [Pseudomonadota bacterium]